MGFAPWRTVRGRLLLLALLIEAIMLAILVGNSLRLLRESMGEQARDQAEQIVPVLTAALVAPLAQYDYATVQAVLTESQAIRGIDYLAVADATGSIVAISGWPLEKALPSADTLFAIDTDENPPRYDVVQAIKLSGQTLGTLHFGLDLTRIVVARKNLLTQGVLIATSEVLISAALLTLLGLLVTRQLSLLTRASLEVAEGNLTPPPMPEGQDDVGRLGAAFNLMSGAVRERIAQLTYARDETLRMAAAREEEHARLDALLTSLNFGILFSDQSERVLYINRAFREIWHLRAEDITLGLPLDELWLLLRTRLAQPDSDSDETDWQPDALRELQMADGRILTAYRRPVAATDETASGYVWVMADVSDERHMQHQLIAARDAAEAANVAKAAFLATMSHEIRTPMNGITGMTQLALGTELSAEQREYMELIRSSADILLTIVNDILDFSKIEAGRMELESTPFDPSQLLDDLTGIFRVTADDKQLTLVRRDDVALPAQLIGDPTRLRQILNNLLSNALKFTPAGGQVSLIVESCAQRGSQVHLGLAVADTGIGVPADKLKTIFDAFTQADSSTTRQYGGTGLGLAIVRRLAILMGGGIHVDSSPGHGSVFHVAVVLGLGADQSDNPGTRRRESDVPESRDNGCRILLAEDNPVNQRVAAGLLKRMGHDVVTAEDGIEAVNLFRQEPRFDLVFMDMQMPNMDGIEATRAIRALESDKNQARIPIVALTANASESDRLRCLDAGMDDFLSKPFHADQLTEIIHRNRPGAQPS